MGTIICNTAETSRNSKQRNLTFYLDAIKKLNIDGRVFDRFEAFCTDGDVRPPYPYQWIAKSTMVPGDDDPFEGAGETPLVALRNLYKEMKYADEHPEEFREED